MNAKLMILGVSYREGFSFFHYIEEMVGVPSRKFIELKGKVEELDGTLHEISIPYYGRKTMDIQYDFDKLIPYLESEKDSLVKKCIIGAGTVRLMEARPVYDRLSRVLQMNPDLVIV